MQKKEIKTVKKVLGNYRKEKKKNQKTKVEKDMLTKKERTSIL